MPAAAASSATWGSSAAGGGGFASRAGLAGAPDAMVEAGGTEIALAAPAVVRALTGEALGGRTADSAAVCRAGCGGGL